MNRFRSTAAIAVTTLLAATACSSADDRIGDTTVPDRPLTTTAPSTTATAASPDTDSIVVNGTTLHVERRGAGAPLLLIHGGGEDASMLAGQADVLAAAGFEVITYDRRGTGRSGRTAWPGGGATPHADDAAALLDALEVGPATVVGVSSGGVVALVLASRHPERVDRVVAWEPPLAGVVPGGAELTAEIMAPIDDHLAAHPGDFVGAQALLLSAIVGFTVTADDPAFAAARANAEAMVRDEPAITLAELTADDLRGLDVTIAVGDEPNPIIAAATDQLAELSGTKVLRAAGAHEVYLTDPAVLTSIVATAGRP